MSIILHHPFERTRDSIFLSPGTDGGMGGIRTSSPETPPEPKPQANLPKRL
ncbi:MAG: hypothetical protein HOI70_06570 [Opitutae bacterium]|nr:hypothetical protein [Opitutae bacterium]